MKKDNAGVRNLWSVVCKGSSVDSTTNSLSVFGILEELQVMRKPNAPEQKAGAVSAAPLYYEIISVWQRESDGEEAEMRVELADPTGKVLQKSTSKINFEKGKKKMRVIAKAMGFPLTIEGAYSFVFSLKAAGDKEFEEVSRTQVEVRFKRA